MCVYVDICLIYYIYSATVTISHIEQAVKRLFSNPYVHAIKGASVVEKIVVVAAVQLLREAPEDAFVNANDVVDRTTEILRAIGGISVPARSMVRGA